MLFSRETSKEYLYEHRTITICSIVEPAMTDRTVVYEFGDFRLDPAGRVFTRQDRPIALAPKSFDLLVLLVERRGRVVGRAELIRELWPDTNVEEANLTFQVS